MTTPKNFVDLTGQTFGRLTVIRRQENTKAWKTRWECLCECGKTIIIQGGNLKNGHTQSCGCLRIEAAYTHGLCGSPEYRTWDHMIQRCTNPKTTHFSDYGGRGITVAPEWMASFPAFYEHIGPKPTAKHTIDRINNNLGYFPGNVRWATQKEQLKNIRRNHNITYAGETMTITEWATRLGMAESTLYGRIVIHNWPIEKAFNKPVGRRTNHHMLP